MNTGKEVTNFALGFIEKHPVALLMMNAVSKM